MTKNKVKLIIIFCFLFLAGVKLFACEFTYTITDPAGKTVRVVPGTQILLTAGDTYTLTAVYKEDHNNCKVPAEDTLFLVEEERWKENKDYLALRLESSTNWSLPARRTHSVSFTFTAVKPGTWIMDVIRECTKGGYKEKLIFSVT